jgi:hypothetical protein
VPKIRKTYIAKVVVEQEFDPNDYAGCTDPESDDPITISNVYDAARWERASESDDDTKWDEFANNQTGDGIEEITLYVEVLEDEKVIEDILDKSADSIKEGLIADGVVERGVFEQDEALAEQLQEDAAYDKGDAVYGGESMDDTLAKVNVLKHS